MKEASAVVPKKGLGRALQLLSGSGDRIAALEAQAASRAGTSARHNATSNRIFRQTFDDAVHGAKVPPGTGEKSFVRSSYRNHDAYRSAGRARAAADAERAAVGEARGLAAKATVGAGLGVGGGALLAHHDAKTAGTIRTILDRTGAELPSMGLGTGTLARLADRMSNPEPVLELTREVSRKPLLSRGTKVIGGTTIAGLGAGVGLAHGSRTKEAFGAALMAGAKGVGRFLGAAGKSIAGAAQTGGVQAAGQAAMNAGRSGAMRAGQFIGQNPAAGAALVAAPALAAGYAASRQ